MTGQQADRGGRWICLDVGETLIEETRIWGAWADELGVPRMTFFSAFGAIIERELDYRDIFEYFPVDDWSRRRAGVQARAGGLRPDDIYPDVLPAIADLRMRGYRVAIIGNQPTRRGPELRALGIDAEVLVMSEELGVAKPDPVFFARSLQLMGDPEPSTVAYVGDRVENDIVPAALAGMRPVWIRRGPWGVIPRAVPTEAALTVATLSELALRADEIWA